jgi:hypothetical protein
MITESNKQWQLEQAMIDAICAKIKTLKARGVEKEQKNAEKQLLRRDEKQRKQPLRRREEKRRKQLLKLQGMPFRTNF